MLAGEGVEKRESSCILGGNVNWYSHYGRQYGDSFKKKKLGIKPPYDPAIPLLSIYPEETKTRKDTCSSHCSLQHYLTKTWKQPRCPSTDEWIKKLIHIHNGILLSHKKEHIWISSDEVDEPRTYCTEWSESNKYRILMHIYGI